MFCHVSECPYTLGSADLESSSHSAGELCGGDDKGPGGGGGGVSPSHTATLAHPHMKHTPT